MKKGDEVMMVNRSQVVKNDRTREEGRGRLVHFFTGVGGVIERLRKRRIRDASSKKKKEWGRGNLMFLMRMKGNQRGRGKGGGRGVGGG